MKYDSVGEVSFKGSIFLVIVSTLMLITVVCFVDIPAAGERYSDQIRNVVQEK